MSQYPDSSLPITGYLL